MPLNRRSALLAGRHGAAAARVRIGRHRAMNPEPGGNTIQLPNRVNGLQQDPLARVDRPRYPFSRRRPEGWNACSRENSAGYPPDPWFSAGAKPRLGDCTLPTGSLVRDQRGVQCGASALSDFAGAHLAVPLRWRAVFLLEPAREMAAVREAAFERDFGDAPRRVQQSPA